ncbi:hypothetical protein EV102420_06_00240 [Pseudescherichia vulneris NBRC 102420]|uniref:Phage protein n=1 Tax=Pseudescherichia vulneris NBRC 102420 TaxID=1115515 RepID=A0A090UX08_PSEVU|nr:hypothetical protein [Pseudescherichia vulneris]GAL57150.1 hypothetical protein EV102420_06_00240 [Pseudescherichia vulneris NBRC 102420]STQ60999.1 Uncharacterised protein [Pseudescherichia vulneris]
MSEFDSKALDLAREVMGLIRQEHIGGDAQLIAKIQLLFVEAMEYASPQLFGNAEQLNSPAVPDCWVIVPIDPTWSMLSADGCSKHHGGQKCSHHENRKRIWRAMLAAAPKQESL